MMGVDSMDGRGTLYTGRETKVTVYERKGKAVWKGKWQYIRRIHSILGGTDSILSITWISDTTLFYLVESQI